MPRQEGPRRRRTRHDGLGHDIRLVDTPESANVPLQVQVYRQLRAHALSGALKPGARLPSARTLARDLRVSRNTVEAAFAQLQSEGFITRKVGAGTVVALSAKDAAPFARVARDAKATGATSPAAALSRRGRLITDVGVAEMETERPTGPGPTEVRGFPSRAWNTALSRRARNGGLATLQSADPFGNRELREAIADQVRLTRGVQCTAGQVVVMNSAQQAIDLAGRLLLDPGQGAAMEEPGYLSARGALLAAGAVVHPVPVDGDGLVVERLATHRDVRLVYVTPSHQYPLGMTMSLSRRLALLQWAAATGAWILEDDYDSEFRYVGRPIAALHGLDRAGRVLYIGTFNKVLFPGVRLAYLVVPPELVDSFAAGRRLTDGFSSPLMQQVLADFLTGGHFASYIRQARQHYESCRDALVSSIERDWRENVRLGPSDTGLHLVTYFTRRLNDARVVGSSFVRGLNVAALSRYYVGSRKQQGLLLSYGGSTPDSIRRAVAGLTKRVNT